MFLSSSFFIESGTDDISCLKLIQIISVFLINNVMESTGWQRPLAVVLLSSFLGLAWPRFTVGAATPKANRGKNH